MKRIILILLCLLVFSGCSALAPDSYLSVTPHENSEIRPISTDAITANDFRSLRNAILSFVRNGQTEGIIHVTNYTGNVETDLQRAAYEVSTIDPLGAYAVEYMTHSCNLLVSYYEIRVSITFRRSAREIADIRSISTEAQMEELLTAALKTFDDRIALRLNNYRKQDQSVIPFLETYCAENYASIMEVPEVSVSVYPETGSSRIVEVNFQYRHNPQGLQAKQRAVAKSVDAAAEYIRYRQQDYEKVQLLYSYLTQRFQYRSAETVTPLYDVLYTGIADPTGLAQAWQLICDKAGVECMIVSGMKHGEPYTWNIIRTGSHYRHLDLAQCVLDRSGLITYSDGQMSAYYWDARQYPACEPLPAAEPPAVTPPEEAEEPDTEETPAEEELPTEEEPPSETPTPDETELQQS